MLASSWVYIITNVHHTTLYDGVTNDLPTKFGNTGPNRIPKVFRRSTIFLFLFFIKALNQL